MVVAAQQIKKRRKFIKFIILLTCFPSHGKDTAWQKVKRVMNGL